jgi:hypothetical protein
MHKTAAVLPLLSVSVRGHCLCLSSQLDCSLCRLTIEDDDLIHDAFVEFYETYTKMTQEFSDGHSINPLASIGPSTEPREEASPEEQAVREAEKAEKKRAKKARQRVGRAEAPAPQERSQAKVGSDQHHFHTPNDALISIHIISANHSVVSILQLCLQHYHQYTLARGQAHHLKLSFCPASH